MKRFLPFAIIALGLCGALSFSVYLNRSVRNSDSASAASRPAPVNLPTTGAEPAHSRGLLTSAITLEEFADFECPACGNFYPILKSIEKQYGSRVRFVFREFPLAQHVHAMPAARAAEAAGLQGKFWEMHDLLYETKDVWTKADDVQTAFEDCAKKIGLDVNRFRQDQKSELVRKRITLDHYRGRAMKLKSTPTLFVNGVEIPYAQMKTVEELRKVIDSAIDAGH